MSSKGHMRLGSPPSVWKGVHCHSAEGLLLVMAHRRAPVSTVQWVRAHGLTKLKEIHLFQADLARAFQLETGYATSAIELTDENDVKSELEGLAATAGSAAVVLVLNMDRLSEVWSSCDWQTRILRFRNSLADQGTKLFVALGSRREPGTALGALTNLWQHVVVNRVHRYCSGEGIGFLGSVQVAAPANTRQKEQLRGPVATVIAHRLASTAFFCCGAFRVGG